MEGAGGAHEGRISVEAILEGRRDPGYGGDGDKYRAIPW